MQDDPRAAFIGEAARLESPLGPLDLGVVDAEMPGIAEGISRLLTRSIQDAREETGGHLPSWLVDDIERNYISPAKVRTLWAATGHRFALVLDREIVGTIHVAKSDAMILTVDRHIINVDEADHPGFKPPRHHHVVNISVRHELRRAHLGRRMVEGIALHFRHLFAGEGLWVRADPPWHPGLSGLGFAHDPANDVFLPPDVQRTADLPHDVFNRRYACACGPRRPELATHKLQYVSMTRPFALAAQNGFVHPAPLLEEPAPADARDFGGTITTMPRTVVRPSSIDELAAVLAWATRTKRRVTIRGRGQSHAGQSLGDDVQLSTERLDRLVHADADRVTMEGGMTWRALATATTHLPAVTPTIVDASIAGTLAGVGLGFGSVQHGLAIDHVESLLVVTGDGRLVECSKKQAGWLFEAVLGGFGQFGVIARVTFRAGRPIHVGSTDTTSVGDLDGLLDAFGAEPTLDAAARATHDRFALRRVVRGERSLASDLAGRQRAEPADRTLVAHAILPRAALASYLAYVRTEVDLSRDDDALWIHPFVERADRAALFLPRVDRPDVLVFSVNLWRELRGRDLPTIIAQNRRLLAEARRLGGEPTLQSGADDLRTYLGPRYERAVQAKRLADPARVLGSLHVIWP